jgi:hypothetical protein
MLFECIILFFKNLLKQTYKMSLVKSSQKSVNYFNSVSNLDKPLLKKELDLFAFCLIFSLIIFNFKMGKHAGNWLVYIYHLISPFLLILAFNFASKLTERALLLIILVISLNLYFLYPQSKIDYTNTYQEWKTIDTLVSQHQSILNSPVIASLLMKQGKKVYDSGESEYFVLGAKRNFFNISFTDHEIEKRNQQFLREVSESVKQQKYDLIILTRDYLPVGYDRFIYKNTNLINECYEYQGTLPATMLSKSVELNIWKPKSVSCDSISKTGS